MCVLCCNSSCISYTIWITTKYTHLIAILAYLDYDECEYGGCEYGEWDYGECDPNPYHNSYPNPYPNSYPNSLTLTHTFTYTP